jgi:hypothetical protein
VHRLKPDFSDFVFIAILVIALALGQQMLSLDSDLGRHLALGNYMLDERVVPTRDLLSHTRNGLSRPPYEWLSQILFALAHRLLGLDGVILFTSLIIALTFTLVYLYALDRSGSALASMALTFLAVAASSIHWLPRPHVFTLLLLVVWIELLDRLTRGEHIKQYPFVVIMLLWANLHGGFVFGILAWVAYLAGWLWETWRGKSEKQTGRKLLTVGIASILATIITPDLWRNWEAVLNNRSAFILDRTVETMRPVLTDISILPHTLLLAVTILLFALNWKNLKANHSFLIAGLGVMSLLMARNIPLFAIAAVPILAEMIPGSLSRSDIWTRIEQRFAGLSSPTGQSVWSLTAALAAIAFFINFNLNNEQTIHRFDPTVFPVEAADFIEANPQQGNMFNDFNWGGYLLHRLWPQHKVFIDSQSDFYGEDLLREYDQIVSANGDWQDLLEKYHVDWVIVPVDSPLAERIESASNWEIIHHDNVAVVGRRK